MTFEDSDSDEPTRRIITEKQNQKCSNDIYMLKKSCCRMSKRIVLLENFIKFKFDDFPLEKDNVRSFPENNQNSRNQRPKRKTASNLKTDRAVFIVERDEGQLTPGSAHTTDFQVENTYSVKELENSQETSNENYDSLEHKQDDGQQEEYDDDDGEQSDNNGANDEMNYSVPSTPECETVLELDDDNLASGTTSQNPLTVIQKKDPKPKVLTVGKPVVKKRGKKKRNDNRQIRKVICKQCNKEYIGKWATKTLKRHMETHKSEKKYLCKYCGRGFTYRKGLKEHEILVHEKEQNLNFVCQYCPERFLYMWTLNKHERLKHKCEVPELPCDHEGCNFKSSFEISLRRHQQTVHREPEKPSFCLYCGEEFSFRHDMKLHIENEHPEEIEIGADGKRVKDAKCYICEATFSSQRSLARHRTKKPESCKPREKNEVISIVDGSQDNENTNEEVETLAEDEVSSIPNDDNGKPDEQFTPRILRKKESLKKPVKFGQVFHEENNEGEEDNDSDISMQD